MKNMLMPLICTTLLASTVTSFGASNPLTSPGGEKQAKPPIYLTASNMSIATGKPSLVNMSNVPVWSLSGGTAGQSVVGLIGLPSECDAVKIEIIVTTSDNETSPKYEDVYRVHLSQMVENAPFTSLNISSAPVRTTLPAEPFYTRTIVLESYYEVNPNAPLCVRVERKPDDPSDSFPRPTGLAMVKVTPLDAPAEAHVVQDVSGYNSWPMIQAIGDKLVCVYSRGSAHSIGEDARAVYARTSTDGGKTWTKETVVADTPKYGEVEVGKGLDSAGAMLLWVRRIGSGEWHHDLYRTTDGVMWTLVATPKLNVSPMQVTDIFEVPTVGLMALWFAGNYRDNDPTQSWGMVTSSDNGATWVQTSIESGLTREDWPTEPSAVYLGNGRILAIGRTEGGGTSSIRTQFQMISTDYGKSWTRKQTNIGEVSSSTPSLILNAKTGLLSNYYYQRGRGILRRRVVDSDSVFDKPLSWPDSEAVAIGSKIGVDSGNVNATAIGNTHYLAFYSGKAPDTAVMVSVVPAPTTEKE